jgi:sterol desaturase/sphingolipid hydroxylase (fatty acid hydroxylase superfamily)
MSIDTIRWITSGAVVICALIIIILERIYPYDKGQKFLRSQFWNDFALYSLVQSYILGVVISYIIQWIDSLSGLTRLHIVTNWGLGWQLLFFLVIHDFYIYSFHRFQHSSKYFWRIHEAHHSTHEVDWLSGSRSHSLEILVNQTIEFSVIVLLGAPPEVPLIKAAMDGVWGMYIHSNIDVHSGWLQYIINGPEMHRWHHATDADAVDKNFSTKLAFWDWIFGTGFLPKKRKPEGYGLTDTSFPENYFQQHVYAFRKFNNI